MFPCFRLTVPIDMKSPSTTITSTLVAPTSKRTVIFIDSGVKHYRSLVEGTPFGADIHVLAIDQDGIEHITAVIQQSAQPIQRLHIISHGAPGKVCIGRGVLSATTLPRYATQLRTWREFLADEADIVLYGCRVAATPEAEKNLLNPLHQLTGATLHASRTLTGNARYGGDWNLDCRIGNSQVAASPPLAISQATQLSWEGLLNTPPTLSSFNSIGNPDEETEFAIPIPSLIAQSDADDTDGTVTAFVVQAVTSAGTLRIGEIQQDALPWEAGSNDVIDNNNTAFWTSNANINGLTPAFSVVAQDDQGATSSTPVTVDIDVNPVNDAPFIGSQPFALYDTDSAVTPDNDTTVPNGPALSFTDLSNGGAIATFAGNVTQLNTLLVNDIYAGYSNYSNTGQLINSNSFPTLDRTQGYLISFALKVNEAVNTDSGSDKNADGLPDRSGFSVIAISSDGQYGIELGFETGRIWAQEDGTRQVDPSLEPDPADANTHDRTLFTQAESIAFATNSSLVQYDLLVQSNTYTLYADGTAILSGRLRDYTALQGLLDPYGRPNFVFFGDNTPSARGRVDIGDISVTSLADSTSYAVTFDEAIHQGNAPTDGVLIVSNLTLADTDGDDIASVVVTLTNPQGDIGEQLFLAGSFNNVNYSLDSANQITLTNTGNATTDEMEAAIAAIRYQNNDDAPNTSDRTISLDVSDGNASTQAISTISVVAAPATPSVLINEINVDSPGTDTTEFIELYDGGVGNTSLDGLTIVLFNGNGDVAYDAFDLNGFSTDANGYFVLGNSAIATAQITFDDNLLQNGADAVALYSGNATDFPNGTAVTTANLLDAIVYGTNDPDDTGLLTLLNAGQSQADEDANGQKDSESLQRFPNGNGGPRNTDSFIAGVPSPGLANAAIIEFASATFSSAEDGGTSAVVTLTRSNGSGQSTVVVSVTGGSAIGGSAGTEDYTNTGFPLTLTFADTEISQVVEIPVLNDLTVEGDETIELMLSSPTNAYLGAQSTTTLTITDNDVPGFSIVESDDDTTVDESGNSTDSFTIQLDSQPLTDVQLTVTSNAPEVATVEPTTLTFTAENWNQAQTVTVSGTDDLILDGEQTGTITVAVNADSSDDAFDTLDNQTVTVTTTDDDSAGFSIRETDDTTTVNESGTTDTFDVVLDRQPLTSVELAIASDNTTEATITPTILTFTSENWNQAQTVTVTGVDDNRIDATQSTTVTVSVNAANSDAAFANVMAQTVTVTTTDDDQAGVSLTQSDGTTGVTEAGMTDTYDVVLETQPEDDVTITLLPDNQLSLDNPTLTFTPTNWNQVQTVTVTAVDDNALEGSHTGIISHTASSNDGNYEGLAISDVTVNLTDNDVAGVVITQSNGTTTVTEGSTTDSYSLVLTAIPTADVTISVTATDGAVTLSDTQLTFTAANWDQPQVVTVTATDDDLVEGPHTSVISHTVNSSDPNFDAQGVDDLTVSITDDDIAGISITELDDSTVVTESGRQDTIAVALNKQPLTDVVLTAVSSDSSEVTVTPTTLVFTPTDWNIAQDITVTGVDDSVVDGTQTSQVTIRVDADVSDDAFDTVSPQVVTVVTEDNEVAGFAIAESGTDTTVDESGTTDTFTVVLDHQPLSDVELVVTSETPTEVTAALIPLTFTPTNWDIPQTVIVTGADDDTVDGSQTSLITVSVNLANSDSEFGDVEAQTVAVTTTDDDVAGVTLTASNETTVAIEGGNTDSYTVVLDTQPTDTVTIFLSPDAQTTLVPMTLTFTPADWNQAQMVTITAVNDDAVEGSHTSTISHGAGSNDPVYDGLAIPDFVVAIVDNDSTGITINESNSVTTISEAGGTDGYTVVLNSQPTADVTVVLDADDQSTLDKSQLVFTPTNWNQPQTVTVTAVNDEIAEGPHTSTLTHSVSSLDSDYTGLLIPNVIANITDNDSVGITVNQTNGTTLLVESGATDGYAIVLDSQPTDDVTITLLPDDQVSLNQTTLIFTPENWNQAQTVTVSAVNDRKVEGLHSGTIAHTVASNDVQYDALAIADVLPTISDDDQAGVTLSQLSATVSEDGIVTETLLITLDGEPLSPVFLDIVSDNPNEVKTAPTRVTLDSGNWDTGVSVDIQGVSDVVIDGEQITTLTVSVDEASSNDAFDVLADQEVMVTTLDSSIAAAVLTSTGGAVNEAGASSTYAIALTSRPSAEVTITFDGGKQLETPAPVTFNFENWNIAQTVTIAAINDDDIEGDHIGLITQSARSADPNYDGLAIAPFTVNITDDDRPTNLIFTFDQYVTFQAIDEGIPPRFDEELYLLANPDVAVAVQNGATTSGAEHYTLYGQAEGRSLFPLELDVGGLNMADFFDETYYLNQYQDVANAVNQGVLANGYEHFLRYGILEGRSPSRYYNEDLYLAVNPDVAAAVTNNVYSSGLGHYLQFGHLENRIASEVFDAEDYLLKNPDVAVGVADGNWRSAFEHFLEAGAHEGRISILLYEESTYLAQNSDVAVAVANNQYLSGFEHYVTYGQREDRDPSVSFDESRYLAANPDVSNAVLNGLNSSGMEHYFRYGRAENRPLG